MDNATYDELNLTPINTDETYSRLTRIVTKNNPGHELQRRADIDQTTEKGQKLKEETNNRKFNVAMIILMVILLLLTLISIALSVTTFNQFTSEQTNMLRQLDKINSNIKSEVTQLETTQLIRAQNNISQYLHQFEVQLNQLDKTNHDIKSAFAQLVTAQNNVSQDLNQFEAQLSHFISQQSQYSSPQIQTNCGLGLWYRLIFLNMSDPSQECPPSWREYTNGARTCGRPVNTTGSCAGMLYLTGQMYSRVCGRAIGYQRGTTDAFRQYANNGIDLDGINITRGPQHDHIWSYVASHTQYNQYSCPCSSGSAVNPPQYIGDRYYCESGNSNDKLWDSQQCEGTCCTGTNSPPWFSVQLPAPTTDAIEVNICCDEGTNNEDVAIELIQIYVQ